MTTEEMAQQLVQQHLVLVAQQMHQVTRITSEILTQFCDVSSHGCEHLFLRYRTITCRRLIPPLTLQGRGESVLVRS